ncbi:methyltransferase [Kitasatospora sp. MMS16-BH015]|uniref:methyltransferase n=1 Tax=Kitasatospora sp. MMS16-BH015 TaxID=2018025 RepID=UPI000CA12B17|nr:methyltransferase [Kitasatospora sp. MMS16-BH015]AUG80279.1 methyltransferase [Kitasatospora sp. MMS16-BH015]
MTTIAQYPPTLPSPSPAPAPPPGPVPTDEARLRAAAEFVREQDAATLLPRLLPGLTGPDLRALAGRCRFAHAAVSVFPADRQALRAALTAAGLPTGTGTQPSVVVRDRLARRHQLDPAELDVRILRPTVTGPDGSPRMVEVFALTVPPGSALTAVADHERAAQHEAHLAFEVTRPDPLALRGLTTLLTQHGATPDGGGHNPHENGTVLYFTLPPATGTEYRRIELYAPGDHRQALAAHLSATPTETSDASDASDSSDADDASEASDASSAETLLRLMTGAWTTQALAVFARLRLADVLATDTATGTEALARSVGADPVALATLLRYLTMHGVLTQDADGHRLTPLGALLRSEATGSLRPLALMYGGPFYQSFAHLTHTVRTGETAFDHLHGENHFEHFARDPQLAELFDRSMAASARMFEPLAAHPAITAAASAGGTVVDVAGGTGELLAGLLEAHPRLRGALLERPHVIDAARRRLDPARVAFHGGDFADVPPGGDVYVLSRILHDWDDDRCREILRHCARAMPTDASLLIVERVLPTDGSPSLATAWDLHMMCNVGGRERTAPHYATLLTTAGLTLTGLSPLPLGGSVLHARKS